MKQCKKFRYDIFNFVCNKNLVAIKLDFVSVNFYVVFDFREVENTREMEREIDIEVNPEQRIVAHWIQFAIETLVVFIFER